MYRENFKMALQKVFQPKTSKWKDYLKRFANLNFQVQLTYESIHIDF